MKIYKVTDIAKNGDFYLVAVVDSDRIVKKIELPRVYAESLHTGQCVVALQDKSFGFEDYVYLYGDTMYFNVKLPIVDEYSCKNYIENLSCDSDRRMFRNALVRECGRRNINVSSEDCVNLHNIVLWDRLGRFVIDQR